VGFIIIDHKDADLLVHRPSLVSSGGLRLRRGACVPLRVLDKHCGLFAFRRDRHVSLGHHLHELAHAPLRLEQAILHRMADPCESLQIGGVETEEVGLIGCFNDKTVGLFNHRLAPSTHDKTDQFVKRHRSPTPGRPQIHAYGCRAEAKESQEITRGPSGVLGSRCVGTGRRSENRDPLPGTLSTSMVPP